MEDRQVRLDESQSLGSSQSALSVSTELANSARGPRTLIQDIEHIKHLLDRSETGSRASDKSITAQVFRPKSSDRDTVPRKRIFAQLELLKRRVRHEQNHIQRSAEADPETDSDSEDGSDDTEEELKTLRQELATVKQQREQWLDAAEARVDALLDEKEALSARVEDNARNLEQSGSAKAQLEQSLKNTEVQVQNLQDQLQNVRKSLEEEAKEKDGLNASRQESQQMVERLRAEHDTQAKKLQDVHAALSKVQYELDGSRKAEERSVSIVAGTKEELKSLQEAKRNVDHTLDQSTERIQQLDHRTRELDDRIQEMSSHSDAYREESKRKHEEMEQSLERKITEAKKFASTVEELEAILARTKTENKNLEENIDEQNKAFEQIKEQFDSERLQVSRLTNDYSAAKANVETITKQRDQCQVDCEAMRTAHERETKGSQEELRKLNQQHEDDLAKLTTQHKDKSARLEAELADSKTGQDELVERLKSEHAQELDVLKSAHEKSTAEHDREAKGLQTDAVSKIDSLGAQLENARRNLATLASEHSQNSDQLKAAHEMEIKTLQDSAAGERASHSEKTSETKARLADLAGQLARGNKDVQSLREELQKMQDAHATTINGLKQKHTLELRNSESTHANEIHRLQQEAKDVAEITRKGQTSAIAELEKAKQDADSSLQAVKTGHSQELERLTAGHLVAMEAAQKQTVEKHERAIEELRNAEGARLAQSDSKHSSEVERLREIVQGIKDAQQATEIAGEERQTAALDKLANEHVLALEALRAELQSTRKGHEAATDTATQAHDRALKDMAEQRHHERTKYETESEERFKELRGAHAAELAALSSGHQESSSQADAAHRKALEQANARYKTLQEQVAAQNLAAKHARDDVITMKEESARSLHEIGITHASEMMALRNQLEKSATDAENAHRKVLDDFETKYEALQRSHDAHEQAVVHERTSMASAETEQRKRLEELQAAHATELAALKSQSEQSAADADSALRQALSDANERYEALQQSQEAGNRAAEAKAHSDLDAVRSELENKLQGVKAECEASIKALISEKDAAVAEGSRAVVELNETASKDRQEHVAEIEGIRTGYEAQLERLRESLTSNATETQEWHEAALLVRDSQAAARLATAQEAHVAVLEKAKAESQDALNKAYEDHEAFIRGMKVDLERASADNQLTLDRRLSEAERVSSDKIADLQLKHLNAAQGLEKANLELIKLRNKLEESERIAQESDLSKKCTASELAALQLRLESEMSSQSEGATLLLEARRMKDEADQQASATIQNLEQRVSDLMSERDTLREENQALSLLTMSETQDQKLEAPSSGGALQDDPISATHQIDPSHTSIETATRRRVSTNLDGATANVPSARASLVDIGTPSYRSANQDSKTPSVYGEQRKEKRASQVQSFEAYLQQAQSELSELGSVITANEALFARKIQEHVGDLQRAKDSLAFEYKQKFDALHSEKERMEEEVSAKQTAKFNKEHEELVASYGGDETKQDTPTATLATMPTPKKKALRSAEKKLVAEYSRRIVKRRSQIALRHAADFQSLTQDYDRKIAELLTNRDNLESDLNIEPSKFEIEIQELGTQSAEMRRRQVRSTPDNRDLDADEKRDEGESEQSQELEPQAETSRPPQRFSTPDRTSTPEPDRPGSLHLQKRPLTSAPRTPQSLPRAVAFPGSRGSPDATARPFTPRSPSSAQRFASGSHPPVRQESLLRPKSPAGVPPIYRAPSPVKIGVAADSPATARKASTDAGKSMSEETSAPSQRYAPRAEQSVDRQRPATSYVQRPNWPWNAKPTELERNRPSTRQGNASRPGTAQSMATDSEQGSPGQSPGSPRASETRSKRRALGSLRKRMGF